MQRGGSTQVSPLLERLLRLSLHVFHTYEYTHAVHWLSHSYILRGVSRNELALGPGWPGNG
jgi:hypothetical protein